MPQMKNKLLKISVLFVFIAFSSFFLYQKDSFQEAGLEGQSRDNKTKSKNHKSNLSVLKVEKEPIVSAETKAGQVFNNRKKVSTIAKIQEVTSESGSVLSEKQLDSVEKLRAKYEDFIVNHPNRKTMALPKLERKAIGLPPNKYNEQDWLYSADPNLGRPTPEITLAIQKDLNDKLESGRVPGDGMDNQWVERGPNNVGGRTRALMFAPGSATKVFAGATSGGLWVNNDITNAASSWSQVSGVPSNMSVTCITVDPQNANIMYIGTGEVYTWGAVNGNGVYKSIDAGVTWRNVFSTSDAVNINDRLTFIQAIIAWRNPTTNLTEVYFGADAMNVNYAGALNPGGATETFGRNTIGVWRSTDGVNFARQTTASLLYTAGKYVTADSFTIDSVGNLFMGTKYSYVNAGGGGKIYKCTTGVDWALVRTLASANGRVQLVASKTTAGRMVALCENATTGLPVIRRSTDAFATVDTSVPLPVSSGTQPPAATDFTRGQAFYDLMIGMNPTNDSEVYVAGIEIFRNTQMFKATPLAADWVQLTDWTVAPTAAGNAVASTLDGVHSDHHVMAFASGLTTRVTFGCDGGIYYSNDSGNAIGVRNNGYNVTQFYKGGINQTGGQKLLAGAQDNGSQLISPAPAAVGSSVEVFGGDGCWEFIDKQNEFMVTSYVYNSYFFTRYDTEIATTYIANDYGGSDGDFVNQCGLDSNANILFANGTAAGVFQIYRYAIDPAAGGGNGATTVSTLSNALLTSIPTYFEASPYTANNLLVGLANGRLIKIIRSNGLTTGPVGSQPAYSSIGDASWVGAISDIRFGASDNEIFVTFHNHGITSVWYSTNGGTSWVSKEGDLPNLSVKCILQNPNATNEVIVGTNLGVWYTVNFNAASPNWRRANNGMKDVPVLSFDYRAADRVILAATYGRGMWTGEFWQCGATIKTWNGTAWSPVGTPTKRDAVVFAGNYTSTASLDACSVTVNAGAAVTFVSGHSLRVGENISVNATGSLTINSGAALVQYTKHAVNTGNIIVKRTSTNMVRNDYTAWSSPVAGQNLLAFSPNTVATRFYEYLFTGTTTPTAYQSVVPSSNPFTLAKGYMIRVDNNWTSTPAAFNGQFTGVPNNGTVTYAVGQGYNLLGNPYASPISAYRFLITNPKVNAVYYWTHTVAAVAGAFPQNNYASYTTLGGTASAAGGAIPNDKINVGQGFFIQAAAAYTVTFENELREDASTTSQFFRTTDNDAEKHRIWLNLNDSSKSYNQILLGYVENATNGIDNKIDGKMLDTSKTMLYNLIDDKEYVIQGKGLPFSDEDVVKLGLKVTEASNFEINIEQVDGLFENQEVFVKDNYIGAIHNLKEGSYYFISQAGTFNDRFELIYKKPAKEVAVSATNAVDVLVKNNELTIQTYQSAIASVEVYDVLGKVIFTKNGIHNKQFNTNQITASQQALIVKIQLENGEVVVKKIIM
jgi:hypothetical protein